jgi:hypothetical protein
VAAFERAIRDAVEGWRFEAAQRLLLRTLPDGSGGFERRPIPVARHAIVRFRVEGGRPIVE